jgi:L-ribulose-5-phosphate 3-epimerase
MSQVLPIGTLLRLPEINVESLQFLREAGLECCQLARVGEEWLHGQEGAAKSAAVMQMLAEQGVQALSLFLSFPAQRFDADGAGFGLTPAQPRVGRMLAACRQMLWARRHHIDLISCHVGKMPAASSDDYGKLIEELRQLARFAAENGQQFLFETGPESALELMQTFKDIGMDSVGVNFDPANLLIYNQEEPADFLELLGERVALVHCKDGCRPAQAGQLGVETPLGSGDTRFAELMSQLVKQGFRGPLIIERELPPGPEQERDVAAAIAWLKAQRQQLTL